MVNFEIIFWCCQLSDEYFMRWGWSNQALHFWVHASICTYEKLKKRGIVGGETKIVQYLPLNHLWPTKKRKF